MPAQQIIVLLSNANALSAELLPALDALGIRYQAPRATPFQDPDEAVFGKREARAIGMVSDRPRRSHREVRPPGGQAS
jgi:hypothetical protein